VKITKIVDSNGREIDLSGESPIPDYATMSAHPEWFSPVLPLPREPLPFLRDISILSGTHPEQRLRKLEARTPISFSGDFVGGDKIVRGDKIEGNKVAADSNFWTITGVIVSILGLIIAYFSIPGLH